MVTLADVEGPIDMVLLDGHKDLYLPLLKLLTPRIRPGGLVVADNVGTFAEVLKEYLEFVRSGVNYRSVDVPIGDRMACSIRL